MLRRTRLRTIAVGAVALAGVLLLWSAGTAQAAIGFRASAFNSPTNAQTSLSINLPAGVQQGDLLLAQIFFEKGSNITINGVPSDWTLVVRTNQSTNVGQAIYRKVAGASEAGPYTWTFSQSVKLIGGILAYSGVDPTNPVVASGGNSGTSSSDPLAPSITATANSWLVALFGIKKNTTLSVPSGMTGRYLVQNSNIDFAARAADQTITTAGTTGTRTSDASLQAEWVAQSVTLREVPPPQPLQVSKTATPAIERTITWGIDKSVEPASWDLFRGDSGTSEYTIDVTRNQADVHTVSGTITITNPSGNTVNATITGVTDQVAGVGSASVVCDQTLPHALAPGASLDCHYGPLTLPDNQTRTNTATVTTSGAVGGGSDDESVNFGGVTPTTVGFTSVTIDDDNDDGDRDVTESEEYSYDVTYACNTDEGTNGNTASITETEQEDSASVAVNCYDLQVAKTVDETEFARSWTWEITKDGDDGSTEQTPLELASGQQYEVNYTVTVDAESADSDHKVTGTITITNPHPDRAATLTEVTDSLNGSNATVDCPSLEVAANDGELQCTYEADLQDGSATENVATATLQNTAFDAAGVGTLSGSTDFDSDTVDVTFDSPTTEEDECATVSDSVDAGPTLPADSCAIDTPHQEEFDYARFIQFSEAQCDAQQALNTASFETNDTQSTSSDDHTVFVNVTCPDVGSGTCTLSQGYWKTHSDQGPAPYDENWANLGDADRDANDEDEGENFFISARTYYQVLWTAPQGNAYYILARQYIAAELNELNGADLSAVQADFDAATTLFATYTPTQIAALRGNNPIRQQFLGLAGILGGYNEDNHCVEDETSAP